LFRSLGSLFSFQRAISFSLNLTFNFAPVKPLFGPPGATLNIHIYTGIFETVNIFLNFFIITQTGLVYISFFLVFGKPLRKKFLGRLEKLSRIRPHSASY